MSDNTKPIKKEPVQGDTVQFSFKYAKTCGSMSYPNWEKGFGQRIHARLKSVCELTIDQFMSRYQPEWRVHKHEWNRTSRKEGWGEDLPKPLRGETGWQFGLGKGGGRIHGFIIDSTFYIVWFDREHDLYPMKSKKSKG